MEFDGEAQNPDSAQDFPFTELKTIIDNFSRSTPASEMLDSVINMFSLTMNKLMPENQKTHSQDFIQEFKKLATRDESQSCFSRTFAKGCRCFLALAESKMSEQRPEQREHNSENHQVPRGHSDNTKESNFHTFPKEHQESSESSVKNAPKQKQMDIDLD